MNKKQDITTTGMPLIDSVVERLCREDSLSTVWHRSVAGRAHAIFAGAFRNT